VNRIGEENRVVASLVKRFQRMHFFTRALLGFVALLIAWANTIPYYANQDVVYAGYGWPFKFLELPTIVIGFPDGTFYPPKSHVFYTPECIVNILVAFAILGVCSVALERYVWTHTRPRTEFPSPSKGEGAGACGELSRAGEGDAHLPSASASPASTLSADPIAPAPAVAAASSDAPKA
jgi:hypothetical protein